MDVVSPTLNDALVSHVLSEATFSAKVFLQRNILDHGIGVVVGGTFHNYTLQHILGETCIYN